MAGYCTNVRPYFHKPQASENTARECIVTLQIILAIVIVMILTMLDFELYELCIYIVQNPCGRRGWRKDNKGCELTNYESVHVWM